MIKILLATGPFECLYSKLARISYKDRNKEFVKNLETFDLLSSLKSYEFHYDETVVQMEN